MIDDDWPDGVFDDTEYTGVCEHGVDFNKACALCEAQIAMDRQFERDMQRRRDEWGYW